MKRRTSTSIANASFTKDVSCKTTKLWMTTVRLICCFQNSQKNTLIGLVSSIQRLQCVNPLIIIANAVLRVVNDSYSRDHSKLMSVFSDFLTHQCPYVTVVIIFVSSDFLTKTKLPGEMIAKCNIDLVHTIRYFFAQINPRFAQTHTELLYCHVNYRAIFTTPEGDVSVPAAPNMLYRHKKFFNS